MMMHDPVMERLEQHTDKYEDAVRPLEVTAQQARDRGGGDDWYSEFPDEGNDEARVLVLMVVRHRGPVYRWADPAPLFVI